MCERKKSTHELSLRSVIENLSFIGIARSAIIGQQLFNDGNCMKQVTKIKRPHIAKLDEVTITRDGETAIIDYKELGISGVNLTLGEEIYQMSDLDILNRHNECIYAQLESMRNYKHVATEIPPGKPQVEYFEQGYHWTPRGDVLRCEVGCDDDGETAILIDDQEFSMKEFGKMLSSFEGWGMRIIFVPEDETCQSPPIEIKDPCENKTASIMLSDESIAALNH